MEWLPYYLLIISIYGVYQVTARSHGVSRHNACQNVSDNTLMIKDEADSCGKFLACIGQIAAHYKCFSNGVFGNSTVECLACNETEHLYEEDGTTTNRVVKQQKTATRVTTIRPKSKKILKTSEPSKETGNKNQEMGGLGGNEELEFVDEPGESSDDTENNETQNDAPVIDLRDMDVNRNSASEEFSTTSLELTNKTSSTTSGSEIYSTTLNPIQNINENPASSEYLINLETTTVEVTITTLPLPKTLEISDTIPTNANDREIDDVNAKGSTKISLSDKNVTSISTELPSQQNLENEEILSEEITEKASTQMTESTQSEIESFTKIIGSPVQTSIIESIEESTQNFENSLYAVESTSTTNSDIPTSSSILDNVVDSKSFEEAPNDDLELDDSTTPAFEIIENSTEKNISVQNSSIETIPTLSTTMEDSPKSSSQSPSAAQSTELLSSEIPTNPQEETSNLSISESTSVPAWSTDIEVDVNFEPTSNQATVKEQNSINFKSTISEPQNIPNESSTRQVIYTVPPEQINSTHTIFAGQLSTASVSKLPDQSVLKQNREDEEKDEKLPSIENSSKNIATSTSENSLSNLNSDEAIETLEKTTQNISTTTSTTESGFKDGKLATQGGERDMNASDDEEKDTTGYCFSFPEYHDEDEPKSTPIIRFRAASHNKNPREESSTKVRNVSETAAKSLEHENIEVQSTSMLPSDRSANISKQGVDILPDQDENISSEMSENDTKSNNRAHRHKMMVTNTASSEESIKSFHNLRVLPLDSAQHDKVFTFKHQNAKGEPTVDHQSEYQEDNGGNVDDEQTTTIHRGLKIHRDEIEPHEMKIYQNSERHQPKSTDIEIASNKNIEIAEANKILIANSIETTTTTSASNQEETHITASLYANRFSQFPKDNGDASNVMSSNFEYTSGRVVEELNSNPLLVESFTSSTPTNSDEKPNFTVSQNSLSAAHENNAFRHANEFNENASTEVNEVKLSLNANTGNNGSKFALGNDTNESNLSFENIQSTLSSNESINEKPTIESNLTTFIVANLDENETTISNTGLLQNFNNENSSEPQIQYLSASNENSMKNQPRNFDDDAKPPSLLPSNPNTNDASMSAVNNESSGKLPLNQTTPSTAADDVEVQAKNTQINLLTDTAVNKKHSTLIGIEMGFEMLTTKKSSRDATDIDDDPRSKKVDENVNDSLNSTASISMSNITLEDSLTSNTTRRKKLRKVKKSRTITTTMPMTVEP